jgi:phenylpropionate dioxygenase-like ring-hydroxylating dioxygenase large terminal subunit
MPSTRQVNATLQSLPCIEQDGMVWIWPGSATPTTTLPALLPPANYTIHAQVCAEPCDTQSYAPPRETFSSLVIASWETLVCVGVMRIEEHWTTGSWIYYIVHIRCKY